MSRAVTMTLSRRSFNYFKQTGRWSMTPRQSRRAVKKLLHRHAGRAGAKFLRVPLLYLDKLDKQVQGRGAGADLVVVDEVTR